MDVRRISAFSIDGAGGNPAGVVVAIALPDDATMQRVAAEVGYSETAFVAVHDGARVVDARYFSPATEVEFCGHATIAAGVVLAELHGPGVFEFRTRAGSVPVETVLGDAGASATLTSVEPRVEAAPDELLDRLLPLLGWSWADVDPDLPPRRAYAGAWHLVMGLADLARLEGLAYDVEGVRALMLEHGLITLQLVHRVSATEFRSRNPFPVGGVVEDPATGAAAAALGAYLRDLGAVVPPTTVTVRQGVEMGSPSLLRVAIPTTGGIAVSGAARSLEG